jgi:NTP pyrophosphatase (non-canonical NTP hydrolase)
MSVESSKDIDKLKKLVEAFAVERDWEKFHTPKNLAMALSVEVSELTEIFQWLTPEQSCSLNDAKQSDVNDELADIFIYILRISSVMNIDLFSSVQNKIIKNSKKYPIELVKGSAKKYTEY